MSKIIIYGIPNCDSIKKTIDWCNKQKIDFAFHNYKKEGIEIDKLKHWCKEVGWETIFNKKGTTWKKMAADFENKKITEKIAIEIMLKNNSIIKRPIIETGKQIIVGYDENVLIASLKN